MMMNIFSIFDPSSITPFISSNWLSMFIIFLLYPYQFWFLPSRMINLWFLSLNYLFKEFKILINYSFSNLIILLSLFLMIFFNNFLGLFPYIFTASSHMMFCLSLALPMWISMLLINLYKFFNDLMSHMTPQGTPIILMPFMVIIETISLIIRPITLSIRLTANMIAGHLLLTLLGSSGPSMNYLFIPFLIFSQLLLLILEISVAMIQAYVFSILLTLYSSEI
uniref:ATP synthase F0 subunit 6 n=1 Tax=Stenamma expolitum TaxID=625355 RepID=UPI001FCD197D|nr:ATP synthase F0 subunit 6 [Stenamma expolitum]UNZ99544.1 ATP synthase F0 subunit 6 [Stenamma expolitum]